MVQCAKLSLQSLTMGQSCSQDEGSRILLQYQHVALCIWYEVRHTIEGFWRRGITAVSLSNENMALWEMWIYICMDWQQLTSNSMCSHCHRGNSPAMENRWLKLGCPRQAESWLQLHAGASHS